jgi:hypothetical protein
MYSNYRMDVIDKVVGPSVAAPMTVQAPVQGRQPGSDKPVNIPDSLVAVQAFIMWEEAGKPQVCRASWRLARRRRLLGLLDTQDRQLYTSQALPGRAAM